MSDADREQRQALITDFYGEWQQSVTGGRKLSADALRSLIDSMVVLTADDALAAGLVDSIGRWPDVKKIIENVRGRKPDLISKGEILDEDVVDPQWGKPPTVALVYTIGECDMDSGIKGRQTSAYLHKLVKRKDVKAVVVCVDSPGGDALPSDLIAEQMNKISEKKPVIVSQGQYAASGGYWLSMNADKIYSTPPTITGSIGVIGGWFWNEKITDKTGFNWDHVQIGKHADLGGGIVLPIIPIQIPDRPLSTEERARVETLIRGMYRQFVGKVAAGRSLDTTYVDSVGQGRAWTGRRALDLKLVDELGGMDDALAYARTQANLKGRRVTIEEYPRRPWFNPEMFMPQMSPIGFAIRMFAGHGESAVAAVPSDYELRYWKRLAGNRGMPALMLDPADVPTELTAPGPSFGD
jgi:protease IV